MTVKTKNYIEVEDLAGLRFECIHCKSAVDIDVEHFTIRSIHTCPLCNGEWAVISNPSGAQVSHLDGFSELIRGIKTLKSVLGPKSLLGLKFKLELTTLSSLGHEASGKI
jgi:hypothetical protein